MDNQKQKRTRIDLSAVPESVQIELCTLAILRTAEAMKTPEGRKAIEKGKQEYLRYKANREGRDGYNCK